MQNLVTKNIEIFRFDEAAKHVYQFTWHSYCDWYLEFLKPIFNSKNMEEIKEARVFSSFMLANILKILHPFIPFFSESVWSKNNYKTRYRISNSKNPYGGKYFNTSLKLMKYAD